MLTAADRPTALLLEDEPGVAETMAAILEAEGYRVEVAPGLDQALDLAGRAAFDAALIDLRVGEDDGLGLLQRLKETSPAVVAVVVTGYGSLESAMRAMRGGAYAYMLKPTDLGELKRTLAEGRDQMARALAAERQAAERSRRLHALAAALSAASAPIDVAGAVVRQASEALGARAGAVVRLVDDGAAFEVVDQLGYGGETEQAARVMVAWKRFPASVASPVADAVRTGEEVMLESTAARHERYPHLVDVEAATGEGAAVAVPLLVEGRAIGALHLMFARDRAFDADERAFMKTIAGLCAQALDRARLYQEARESEARYRALVEQSADAIVIVEGATAVYANDAYLRLVGTTDRAQVIGRTGEAWVHPDDRGIVTERALARQRGEAVPPVYEYRVVRPDGEVRTVEVSAATITHEGRPATLAVIRDVTERARARAAEHLLVEAGAALSSSLDYEATLATVARLAARSLADWCVIDVAEDGDPPQLRRVAAAHVDPTKEVLLRELRERYPALEPGTRHTARRVFETGQAWFDPAVSPERLAAEARDEHHLELLRSLGFSGEVVVPLGIRGRVLGAMTLVAGSARRYDRADLALAEELARRCARAIDNAQHYAAARAAVRARDEFLGVAAHELKTPMTSLMGHAQLVLRQIEREGAADPARVRRAMGEIERQTRKLNELVARLLDVSRIEANKLALAPEPTDLRALVERVLEMEQRAAPDHLFVLRAPEPVAASVDPLRFEQVVVNLLDNAVKFSPPGSPIEVVLGCDSSRVSLAVRDHGPGVPLSRRGGLFERFHQAHGEGHRGGMGLGLFICRQIVELHGGAIRAEFPEDGGARFVVEIPLESAVRSG